MMLSKDPRVSCWQFIEKFSLNRCLDLSPRFTMFSVRVLSEVEMSLSI